MANKRMFNKMVIDSDAFLDMPQTSQNLYFHLNMRADDDGFVNSPKKVMRSIGSNQNDLELLLAKRYLLAFDSGVIVIKHWKLHNTIRKDRYRPTLYSEELKTLIEKDNGIYTESYNVLEQKEIEEWQPTGNQLATNGEHSIDKVRLDIDKTKKKINKKDLFSEILKYWNEKVPGQETLLSPMNMSIPHEVAELLNTIGIDKIKQSIDNYSIAYDFNDFKVSGFINFMTFKQVDFWHNESSVKTAINRKSSNKNKPVIKNVSDEDLKRIEKEAEEIVW